MPVCDNLLLGFVFTILCFREFTFANTSTHNNQYHQTYADSTATHMLIHTGVVTVQPHTCQCV